MKILCKVKPDYNVCCNCIDDQEKRNKPILECNVCLSRIPEYEILKLGHSFWIGDYAMVLTDAGHIERYRLDRICCVRTEHRLGDGVQQGLKAMVTYLDELHKRMED